MYSESILSFCNNIRTKDGGSHVDGLKNCLTRTVNACGLKSGKIKVRADLLRMFIIFYDLLTHARCARSQADGGRIPGEFIREGLTAIVTVNVMEPEFEGQVRNCEERSDELGTRLLH